MLISRVLFPLSCLWISSSALGCGYVSIDLAEQEQPANRIEETPRADASLLEDSDLIISPYSPTSAEVNELALNGTGESDADTVESSQLNSEALFKEELGTSLDESHVSPISIQCEEDCTSSDSANITCAGPICRPECQEDIDCAIAALDASPVIVDCRAGASCSIDSVQNPNFQAQCFEEGNCIADCGEALACELQCVNGGDCSLNCQGLAACALLCDWTSSCSMTNAPQGGMVCPDPGVFKECGNGTWTCNAPCPAKP